MIKEIKPYKDFVLAKYIDKQDDGMILQDPEQKTESSLAEVIEIGPDVKQIKTGSTIVFDKGHVSEMQFEGVDYIFVKEENVVAVIT